ncbi:alcohol dehydrogenase catalytic domain-containing protein [Corynebacterium breve]|uniref:alcohol dehydrogenase n=1 Tax=Corynebacterium breve TaxID=3049799 RepID=A0ABY8VDE0_9CORY|nr:alcohol dehydrogenase catalytic domain-containing protein [Corynebacterium breve]WIM67117.1 alcohol dehydrogenase catalytic domain-containing protein [Corynebacterium breve]
MTARAQLWQGGLDFTLIDIPLPELNTDELLVELTAATICGSDRHTVEGRRSSPCPSILGHEGVGVVVASRRATVPVGTRVVFSVTAVCGTCAMCTRGLTAKCTTVMKAGHEEYSSPWPLSGTYASHIHVVAGQEVVEVPDSVSDGAASTAGCAVATVMAVIEAAGDLSGKTVLVNGVGMLGLIACAAARGHGAAEVIGCDPNESSSSIAHGVVDRLVRTVGDVKVDVVLELSGARQGVIDSVAALKVGGIAVLAGSVTPTKPINLDPEWLVRGWRTITGVHNYEPRHIKQAVDFLVTFGSVLPWGRILGGPIPLADLPIAFAHPDGAMRTIVVP